MSKRLLFLAFLAFGGACSSSDDAPLCTDQRPIYGICENEPDGLNLHWQTLEGRHCVTACPSGAGCVLAPPDAGEIICVSSCDLCE